MEIIVPIEPNERFIDLIRKASTYLEEHYKDNNLNKEEYVVTLKEMRKDSIVYDIEKLEKKYVMRIERQWLRGELT